MMFRLSNQNLKGKSQKDVKRQEQAKYFFSFCRLLQPDLVLERLTAATIHKWTRKKKSKARATVSRKFNFNCDVCGKFFVCRSVLNNHLKTHFKLPHLFCDLCPKSFRDKKGLFIHMTSHLPNKPFTCRKCGFGTIYKHSVSPFVTSAMVFPENPKVKVDSCFIIIYFLYKAIFTSSPSS